MAANKLKSKGFKIGAYIRVSTEEQSQNPEGSIKNQEDRIRSHINYKNMDDNFGELTEVYIDRAMSGKNTNRPSLQRMLKAIKNKEIDFVMATELSRISRSIKDFSEIWELMQKNDCGFQSLRENFDSTTAAGEMMIFSIANLAQFERRQTAERVSQNFNARAKRGLYNGGTVPFGYELIKGKPGFLRTNHEHAQVIKKCFEYFLKHETLSQSAKALNKDGYRLQKYMQGGGRHQRLSHFTVDNLHCILRNKMYKGVKTYKEGGEVKEAKAVWEAIIDENTFKRVGKLLTKNKSRKKPHSKNRYPYQLSGIIFCKKCGNHLSGKSAWGSTKKIPYYEHSWSTKKGSTLTQKTFDCGNPRRFSGKLLEQLVNDEVIKLLSDKKLVKKLFLKAQSLSQSQKIVDEVNRVQAQVYGFNSQLEALAERLSILPKAISPDTLFRQMEKVEERKKQAKETLKLLKLKNEAYLKKSAKVKDFLKFTESLKEVFIQGDAVTKEKIIKRLIHKIEVNPDEVTLHLIVDQDYYPKGPKYGPHLFLCPKSKTIGIKDLNKNEYASKAKKAPKPEGLEALQIYLSQCVSYSSNSLTFGAPERT